jgi:HSP20 family protein
VLVNDAGVAVYMDMPGVNRDQLEIELENDVLSVRGERPFSYGADNGTTTRRIERSFGRFERSLRVPRGLDPGTIEASLANGVLSMNIPKPESLKPRKIEVKAADEAGRPEDAHS